MHEAKGHAPFELTFGHSANLPSALTTVTSLTYDELLQMWKVSHKKYLTKAKETITKNKEKRKRQNDLKVAKRQTIFKEGNLVCLYNNNKKHKLEED